MYLFSLYLFGAYLFVFLVHFVILIFLFNGRGWRRRLFLPIPPTTPCWFNQVEELQRYNSAIHGRTAALNGGGTDFGGPVRKAATEVQLVLLYIHISVHCANMNVHAFRRFDFVPIHGDLSGPNHIYLIQNTLVGWTGEYGAQ